MRFKVGKRVEPKYLLSTLRFLKWLWNKSLCSSSPKRQFHHRFSAPDSHLSVKILKISPWNISWNTRSSEVNPLRVYGHVRDSSVAKYTVYSIDQTNSKWMVLETQVLSPILTYSWSNVHFDMPDLFSFWPYSFFSSNGKSAWTVYIQIPLACFCSPNPKLGPNCWGPQPKPWPASPDQSSNFVDLNLEDRFFVCFHLKYNFKIYFLFYMFRKCKKLHFITRYWNRNNYNRNLRNLRFQNDKD